MRRIRMFSLISHIVWYGDVIRCAVAFGCLLFFLHYFFFHFFFICLCLQHSIWCQLVSACHSFKIKSTFSWCDWPLCANTFRLGWRNMIRRTVLGVVPVNFQVAILAPFLHVSHHRTHQRHRHITRVLSGARTHTIASLSFRSFLKKLLLQVER